MRSIGYAERAVGGARDSKHLHGCLNDRIRRLVKVLSQLGCWNAHHGHAALLEPSVTPLVTLRSITHVVAYAVNLDCEICFCAVEVEDVWPDRMLPAEYRLAW
jgi:hypothetical protein